MKYKYYFLALALVLSLSSCSDSSTSVSTTPRVNYVTPKTLVVNREFYIYGENFGVRAENSGVILFDGLYISSQDTVNCSKWNASTIQITVPFYAKTGKFKVVVAGDTIDGISVDVSTSLPIEFVNISPATFWMGSNEHPYESPEHQVTLTQGYSISKYEISQWQWKAIMGYNPSININEDFPVENVSWLEAIKFCNKMSSMEKLDSCYIFTNDTTVVWNNKFANGYRLPSEAEWECAAKANNSQTAPTLTDSIVNLIAVYNGNSGYKPRRVGSMAPNAVGLYDMMGNVWEWCWDNFSSSYYTSAAVTEPYGPDQGDRKVARGGSFRDGAFFCRYSTRIFPIDTTISIGVRLVKNAN